MSEFPQGRATAITERIMRVIKSYLKEDELGRPHNYNRTYEQVWEILDKELGPETQRTAKGK